MKFNRCLIAAAALMAFAGAAHAAPETFTLAQGESQVSNGRVFSELSGTATWQFSAKMITFVQVVNIGGLRGDSLQAVPDASIQLVTAPRSDGSLKAVSVASAAPITSLTSDFDGSNFKVQAVESSGGVLLTTIKNGATMGPGSLSISDLKVDLSTKTIYADIAGGNGLGELDDHALWKFSTVSGDTSFGLPADALSASSTLTLSGLFLVNAADIGDIFMKGLNLNNIGRSTLESINRPSATHPMGFGSITLSLSVSAVPEPSTWALMGVGLVGLALFGRRGAGR